MNVGLTGSEAMSEWDEYVHRSQDSTAYHLAGWRRIISRVFHRETYYLAARDDNGRICGVLPLIRLKSLLFGDFLVSMPYLNYGGLLADSGEVATQLIESCTELAAKLGVRHVELRHTRDDIDLPTRTDRICMRLQLPDDSDSLWKQLGSKLRSQIKRPLREGAVAATGGAELVREFYPIFATKYRELGVPVYPLHWFEMVLEEFPDRSSVHLVTMQGRPVAASIVIRYRNVSEVAWAASVRAADRLGANMYLYWSMLEAACKQGVGTFDFGRTTEGSGTHHFKKQWGAQPVQLYWHYVLGTATEIPRLNLDNPKFHAAAAIWRRLPLWATNSIGPKIVKNLP